MNNYRLWCDQCKKEFTTDEADEREVDTMWGDGRWWHCRSCGKQLILYPNIGEKEQRTLSRVRETLATIKNAPNSITLDELCELLMDIQESYVENQNRVDACQVLFNLKEIAQKNDLPQIVIFADTLYAKLAKNTLGLPKQEIVSVAYLLENYIAYFCPPELGDPA